MPRSGVARRDFLKIASAGALSGSFAPSLFAAAMSPSPRLKTLVIGGTAFSLGFAAARPGRCVIVERGIHLAPEFSQVGDWGELGDATSECGREMADSIRSAGLVTDGRLELPPLSDFLHRHVEEMGLSVFCNVELVSFKRNAGGFRALVCGGGSSGLCEANAASLLDATPVGWRDCGMEEVEARTFSAVTADGIVSVTLPANATRREARMKLWGRLESPDGRVKPLAEANELGTVYRRSGAEVVRREVAEGWKWIPSAQFGTFMSAFEEGVKCALA